MTIPNIDASYAELKAHFIKVQDARACVGYESAIHMCLGCAKPGENTQGKSDAKSGRAQFCSEPCQALYRHYQTIRKQTPA